MAESSSQTHSPPPAVDGVKPDIFSIWEREARESLKRRGHNREAMLAAAREVGRNLGPRRPMPTRTWRVIGTIDGKCSICSLAEHTAVKCPYVSSVPKNAIVSDHCDIVCRVCHGPFSSGCCGQETGSAKLRICDYCDIEHLDSKCPEYEKGLGLFW